MTIKNKNTSSKRKKLLTGAATAALMSIGAFGVSTLPATTALADAVKVVAPQAPSFADVVESVSPAVVSVRVEVGNKKSKHLRKNMSDRRGNSFGMENLPEGHPLKKFFEGQGKRLGEGGSGQQMRPRGISQGSGFFISEDGYVVTNNHVVKDGTKFTVVDNNGEELSARLIGVDPKTDLAVLKVDSDREFTYVALSDEDTRIGEWVVAVGNPFGLGGTVTAGIVSARGRDIGSGPYDDFLQIDAAVNKGNSGGPSFSLDGRVIGVNTAIYSPSGGNVGIAFAVPAKLVKQVTEDLIENGSVVRGWLGVQIQPVTNDIAEAMGLEEARGAIVVEPTSDGPAEKAGLIAGDVIVEVSGKTIKGPKKLAAAIAAIDPDKKVAIKIMRDGKAKTVNVKLGQIPGAAIPVALKTGDANSELTALETFGMAIESHDGQLVIVDIDPDSNAAEKGLRAGDVLVGVNGEKITDLSKAEKMASSLLKDGRKAVLFQIKSENGQRFVAIQPTTKADKG